MSPVHIGLLSIVLLFLIAILEVGIIESAYQKLGMSHRAVTLLLLLSIFGSYINIPVATISPPPIVHHRDIYNLSYIPALLASRPLKKSSRPASPSVISPANGRQLNTSGAE